VIQLAIYLLLFVVAGCAAPSPRIVLLDGMTASGARVCLEDEATIPVFFDQYYEARALESEEDKIDYLIERVNQSGRTFVRNGVEFGSYATAQFLRWKLDRLRRHHDVKVHTADEFITKIGSGSRVSGIPYAVEIEDGGGQHNLQFVLANELSVLESCLSDQATEDLAKKEAQTDAAEIEKAFSEIQ
jgi:hypothetical protein